MSTETELAAVARTPRRWLRHTDIPVRQRENEPPTSARPRFAWNMGEVSGSLGDLGTFLPHIVGAITVVKMDPTGILASVGLFYAFTGAFYGVPMVVQPMKAASAAVLCASISSPLRRKRAMPRASPASAAGSASS